MHARPSRHRARASKNAAKRIWPPRCRRWRFYLGRRRLRQRLCTLPPFFRIRVPRALIYRLVSPSRLAPARTRPPARVMSIHNSRQGRVLSTFLYSLVLLTLRVSAICYYPDGTVTPGDVPCLTGNDPSFCCSFGYACLNNQICMTTPHTPNATNTYVRGSCTDPTWRSANCPSFCVNPDPPWKDDTGGGEGMVLCPNTTNTFYCFDFNEDAVNCAERLNIAVEAAGMN